MAQRARGASGGRSSGRAARSAPLQLAPVVLVKGPEGLIGDRAVDRLRALALEVDPSTERTELPAVAYRAGQLDVAASPSLFGEPRFMVVPDLETMPEALQADLLSYITHPAPDVWLVLRHHGGTRGKKLTDAIARAGWPVVAADPLKSDRDKLDLVHADVRRAHRQIDQDAAQALVDALGDDLRSLCAAVAQLLADVEGRISLADVRRYHAGRVETTGFEVADATVAGRTAQALTLLRHALSTGVDPIPIVAALALKVRAMAKVSVVSHVGSSRMGMAPWQVERARRDLHGWDDAALAAAIGAIAVADEEAKGLSRDPERAVEKAVMEICRLRRSSR